MRFCRRVLVPAVSGLLIFFITNIPVVAAEGEVQDPVDATMGVFFKWLNFAIVFGGIAYLISKYGGSLFRQNAKAISAKITEATAAKASADAELHEVQAKITNLDREVAGMREDAAREATVEAARLRESTRVEIEKSSRLHRGNWLQRSAPRDRNCAVWRHHWPSSVRVLW